MEHAQPYAPFDTQTNRGDIASLSGPKKYALDSLAI
jgi:hypothetical protein